MEEKKKKQPKFHKHFIGNHKKHPDDKKRKKKKKSFSESLSFSRIKDIHGSPHKSRYYERLRKLGNKLSSHYNENALSEHEHESIKHYTGEGAEEINDSLYHGRKPYEDPDDLIEHRDDHIHIQNGLSRFPSPRSMSVYSGMRSLEGLPHENGHIHVENPPPTSTSIDPNVGQSFANLKKRNGQPSEHKYWVDHRDVKNNLSDVNPPVPEGTKADPNNPEHRELGVHLGNIDLHKEKRQGGRFVGYGHIAKIHVPRGSRGMYVEHITQNEGEREHILPAGSKFAFKKDPVVDHETKTVMWHGKLVHDGFDWTSHGVAMGLDKQNPKQGDLFDGNK
jgi:hypothetical protein